LERDPVSFKSHHLLNTLFPDAGMLHSVPQYNAAHAATLMIAPMSIVNGPDGSARAAGARGQKNAILLHEHTPNKLVSYMCRFNRFKLLRWGTGGRAHELPARV
jgi:hypothetical protein